MNHSRLLAALFLPILLGLGCAVSPDVAVTPPQIDEYWVGQLNARDGKHHDGSYALTLSNTPAGLSGEYTLTGDRCVDRGQVFGKRNGAELQLVVTRDSDRIELNAAIDGESLFGTYRFIGGPCQGEWGSTMARREAPPK